MRRAQTGGDGSQCRGIDERTPQEFPGDLNWNVSSCRPAESIREQWWMMVSTSNFRLYTFVVVRDALAQLMSNR
jgi:hypothetical protein